MSNPDKTDLIPNMDPIVSGDMADPYAKIIVEPLSNMQITGPRIGSPDGPLVYLRPDHSDQNGPEGVEAQLCLWHRSGTLEVFPVSRAQLLNLARQALDIATQMGMLNDRN